MGKTKIKTIDDSAQAEETKKPAKKLGRRDELVERLKAELATEEKKLDVGSEKMDEEVRSLKLEEIKKDQTSTIQPPKPISKVQHPASKKLRSKKYQAALKDLDKNQTYPLTEAVDMVKKLSYAKFNATLEAHINTSQTGIRGLVSLPYASGKKIRILAFGPPTHPIDTQGRTEWNRSTTPTASGVAPLRIEDSVILGDDSTIEEINKGKVDFDLIITTPECMSKLARVARILGPKGLMPNPKNGTITQDLKKTVEGFQAGKTEYKTEGKAPVIHLGLGKLNQPTEQLSANISTLLQTLGKTKVKKVTLSPTMGPSVKLDLASI